jgi:histidinol-phosphate/aromatic aminotransferase/cobyric acid decarboxylase-like protein
MTQATLVHHGTLDYAELRKLGLRPEDITSFSSNINPFGPPPAVIEAMRNAPFDELVPRYPDRLSLELRDLLAAQHGLSVDSILVGNGTADILWLLGLVHLQHCRVAILGPTFGEYLNVAQLMQAEVINLSHPGWSATAAGYRPETTTVDDVAKTLGNAQPDVIFVCNPNNPTGHYLAPDALTTLYDAAPTALWIIDEAYAEFMDRPATTAAWVSRGNWLVLRSMTKDFALGGLRLGYVLGAPSLIQTLQTAQSPWNVNLFAQVAGAVALREGLAWRRTTLTELRKECALLQEALRGAGYKPYLTTVSYFLVPVYSPATVRETLLAQRLIVRDCTSFGLPDFIRIAVQRPEANARLMQALIELAPTTTRSSYTV